MNNLEVSKLRLETLKAEYTIIRDKLFLFTAFVIGGFLFLTYFTLPFIGKVFLYLVIFFSSIGLILNLKEFNKISKEIEELIKS